METFTEETPLRERILHDSERIQAIRDGELHLTEKEREFLVTNTPTLEMCDRNEAEMRALPDSDIMEVAYWTWVAHDMF